MSDNPQMDLARKFLEQTGINVFLTGKAGTGKTTFPARSQTELAQKNDCRSADRRRSDQCRRSYHSLFLPASVRTSPAWRAPDRRREANEFQQGKNSRHQKPRPAGHRRNKHGACRPAGCDERRLAAIQGPGQTVRRRTVADDRGSPATRSCRKTTGMGTARRILRVALLFRQCGAAGSQIHHSGIETCLSAERYRIHRYSQPGTGKHRHSGRTGEAEFKICSRIRPRRQRRVYHADIA